MDPVEVNKSALGKLHKFASGNQAVLYKAPEVQIPLAPDAGPLVYKEYKDKVVSGRRLAIKHSLAALQRVRLNASERDRKVIDGRSVWPIATVTDEDGATGLIMREIPKDFFVELQLSTGRVVRDPCEAALYLQPDKDISARGLALLSEPGRIYITARALNFMSLMHDLDVVLGDLSAGNMLMRVDERNQERGNRPMFVDVDSYRVVSGVPAILQPHTPDWETPESRKREAHHARLKREGSDRNQIAAARSAMRIQDKASDVYKAGLLILRFFHIGGNAHAVVDSKSAVRRLHQLRGGQTRQCVLAALDLNPKNRPSMKQLAQSFVGA